MRSRTWWRLDYIPGGVGAPISFSHYQSDRRISKFLSPAWQTQYHHWRGYSQYTPTSISSLTSLLHHFLIPNTLFHICNTQQCHHGFDEEFASFFFSVGTVTAGSFLNTALAQFSNCNWRRTKMLCNMIGQTCRKCTEKPIFIHIYNQTRLPKWAYQPGKCLLTRSGIGIVL